MAKSGTPEEIIVMTEEMRQLLSGGRDPISADGLPRFSADMAIGATARWDAGRAITRNSTSTWSLTPIA